MYYGVYENNVLFFSSSGRRSGYQIPRQQNFRGISSKLKGNYNMKEKWYNHER